MTNEQTATKAQPFDATDAPWEARLDGDDAEAGDRRWRIYGAPVTPGFPEGRNIAALTWQYMGPGLCPETEANARLLAASPRIRDALAALIEACADVLDVGPAYDDAIRALKEAEAPA